MQDEAGVDLRRQGMFESGKQFSISLIRHLRSRLELLGLELSQEKGRLLSVLMILMFGYLMAGVTLLLGVLLAVAAAWDTPYRLQAIGGMLVGSVVVMIVVTVLVRRRLRAGSTLFKSSLGELSRDEQALEQMH